MQHTIGCKRPSRKQAIDDMARLLSKELSMVITPEAVRKTFDSKWATLSNLAHAIHDGNE